jgi:predicted amidohydrolase
VDWNPTQPLPHQLADAFAVLYDWVVLRHKNKAENRGWRDVAIGKSPHRALIRDIESSAWETPIALQDHLTAAPCHDENAIAFAAYQCLRAIDDGLGRLHPTRASAFGSSTTGLAKTLLTQYRDYGRYNDATDGYILPKWTKRFRGTAFAEHFTYLVRVRPDAGPHHLIRPGRGRYRPRWSGNPRVAVVPFLYTLDDAPLAAVTIRRQPLFQVLHVDLEDRVRSAVDAIRASTVNIAIFPELVLDERLLAVLRDRLRTTDRPGASLEWVIVGAAIPADPEDDYEIVNAALVLNRVGKVVSGPTPGGESQEWVQLKRHRYKMTTEEQKRYGLCHCFGKRKACDREEAISVGGQQIVFEDRTGRYAVLICEDWGQEEETTSIVRELRCSVVIAIVMDGPMLTDRWAARRAEDIVAQTGSVALLANSLLLPNQLSCRRYLAKHKDIPDPFPDRSEPVGLLYAPGGARGAPRRPSHLVARATPDPADVRSLLSHDETSGNESLLPLV